MRFLVTNDDGIESVFLHELVHALHAAGHELYIVAPQHEQSWVGAAKSRNRPVRATATDRGLGGPTWMVDGTPSDAINIACAHLLPPDLAIDAVISGINIGLNASLGFIIASGTIAGAWEGALHGFPAIAFSQALTTEVYDQLKAAGDVPDDALLAMLRAAAHHAARLAPTLALATPHRSFIVHNVNFPFPCEAHSEVRATIPAHVLLPRLFSAAGTGGAHRLVFRLGEDISPASPLTDRAALAQGFISHTKLDYKNLGHSPA